MYLIECIPFSGIHQSLKVKEIKIVVWIKVNVYIVSLQRTHGTTWHNKMLIL